MSLLAAHCVYATCAVVHANACPTTTTEASVTENKGNSKGKGKTSPFCVYQTSVCEKLYNKSQSTSAAISCSLCLYEVVLLAIVVVVVFITAVMAGVVC